MENHDSTQKEIIASGNETPSTDAGQNTTEYGRPGPDPTEGKGLPRSEPRPIASLGEASGLLTEWDQKQPVSPRKLAANRLNAKRSTGPRTPGGKANSSRNSYKLGIFARQIFPPTEQGIKDWERYKDMVTGFYDHYRPEGVIEELLVDKVVTEAVRFARILGYEFQELSQLNAFWNQPIDRVLKIQTALDRQLTKAIEQLEDRQAMRKAAMGNSESFSDPESDGVVDEQCEVLGEPVPGDKQQPTSAASRNGSDTRPLPAESSDQAIAAQEPPSVPGEPFSSLAGISNSGPEQTEKYKTNPPSHSSGGGNVGTTHERGGRTHTFLEVVDRAVGLVPTQEPNNILVSTSGIGSKLQDARPQESSEEDLLNSI